MQISKDQKFLHISLRPSEDGRDYETTLAVVGRFKEVLASWNSGSRMSPVWRVKNGTLEEGGVDVFPTGFIFFRCDGKSFRDRCRFLSTCKK